ncbi:hypothetical protein MUP46_00955 [Patescibacteria group bacterium]|nr:hypothetical protein [Patescibacteria group bacterium]
MNKWLISLLLGFSAIFFLLFHIILPLHNGIQLNTVDAYYMVRYADIWPNIPAHDYFFNYPVGTEPMSQMVFPAMIALTAKLFHTDTTTAGAWIPPILFLLTLIPVYVIARALFKEKLIAALSVFLLALMPGEILSRTMLGAADYHCLEILLLTTIMMFGILAVKDGKQRIVYSLFGLVFTGLYLLSWYGAPLFLFILAIFLIALFCKKWQAWVVIAIVYGAVYLFVPNIFKNLSIFIPNITTTVGEMMPLFFTAGQFDFVTVIGYFSIAFFLTLFGIGVLLHQYIKSKNKETLLFLVWSVIMLALTFSARRFAYYSAINIAIMSAFISVYIVKLFRTDKVKMTRIIVALTLMLCLLFGYRSTVIATSGLGTMPKAWQECCTWLRTQPANVPTDVKEGLYFTGGVEISPGCYFGGMLFDPVIYETQKSDRLNYGVLSHWNYGYWIVQAGHMPASYTPGNGCGNDILCKSDITLDIVANKWRYIILDKEMFTTNAYPIFYVNNVKPEDTAVYKLFYFGKPVWESTDGKVKVFEVLSTDLTR